MKIITKRKKKKIKIKIKITKKEYVRLHLHIHVGHIKQPRSISEILYGIFKLTYAHTDPLNFYVTT